MSETFIPYDSLTEDKQKEAIKLARRQQSLAILFSIGIRTELPTNITIQFKCTNCTFVLDIHYQIKDWIKIDVPVSFACTQDICKGTLAPEVW